jgi:pimeloyl-ACP methyl ester carboxylesterase
VYHQALQLVMGGLVSKFAFVPPPATYARSDCDVWLTTTHGSYIPLKLAMFPDSHFTIIFSHANAEDLGLIYPHLAALSAALRCSIVCYDYSGYGLASGESSEQHVYADIQSVFRYVTTSMGIPHHRVVLYGRSLGSGPSVELAHNEAVGGVILQSAFTSIISVASKTRFMSAQKAVDAFCNSAKIHRISCPVLLVHGTRDNLVPISHARDLFARCQCPFEPLYVDAGHNDIEQSHPQLLVAHLTRFLEHLIQVRNAVASPRVSPLRPIFIAVPPLSPESSSPALQSFSPESLFSSPPRASSSSSSVRKVTFGKSFWGVQATPPSAIKGILD